MEIRAQKIKWEVNEGSLPSLEIRAQKIKWEASQPADNR